MKQLGCLVVGLALLVGGFAAVIGIAGLAIRNTDNQSHLTQEVDVTVVSTQKIAQSPTSQWRIDYRYSARGQRYAGQGGFGVKVWNPDMPLVACVDPDNPAEHVLKVHASDHCGQELIRVGISTATPAPATAK